MRYSSITSEFYVLHVVVSGWLGCVSSTLILTLVLILYDVLDVVLVRTEVQFLCPCPDIRGVVVLLCGYRWDSVIICISSSRVCLISLGH